MVTSLKISYYKWRVKRLLKRSVNISPLYLPKLLADINYFEFKILDLSRRGA